MSVRGHVLRIINQNVLNNFDLELRRFRRSPDSVSPIETALPGRDLLKDLSLLIGNPKPRIFDIGASRGDSIRAFRYIWPESSIVAFEKDPTLLEMLKNHWDSVSGVEIIDSQVLDDCSDPNSSNLLDTEPGLTDAAQSGTTEPSIRMDLGPVPTISLSKYCATRSIDSIDILNVAVKGPSQSVLNSAKSLLQQRRISTVILELVFDHLEMRETTPALLFETMDSLGFACTGLYNQCGRIKQPYRADSVWHLSQVSHV